MFEQGSRRTLSQPKAGGVACHHARLIISWWRGRLQIQFRTLHWGHWGRGRYSKSPSSQISTRCIHKVSTERLVGQSNAVHRLHTMPSWNNEWTYSCAQWNRCAMIYAMLSIWGKPCFNGNEVCQRKAETQMLTLRRKLTAYSVFCSQCGWLLFAKASWCEKHCGPSKGQKCTSCVMLWTLATVHSYFWNWKWSGLEGVFSSAASSFCNFSSLLPNNICQRSTWSTVHDLQVRMKRPS